MKAAGVLLFLLGAGLGRAEPQGAPRDTGRVGPRIPAAPAPLARMRGWMPLASTGVPRFLAAHPEWDGRGVLIAILDSGVDPGAAGLETTSTGLPKILDLRDFSGEAAVSLGRVTPWGDTIALGGQRLLGMNRVRGATTGPWYAGWVLERPLGQLPAADLNDNGTNADSLAVVAGRTAAGWVLFTDTDGDGSLANERPVADFLGARETFGWHARGQPAPLRFAANFSEDASGAPVLRLAFDTEAHGTHVAGIAAARGIGGVPGFDGVAPGAQLLGLKISRNDLGGITTTGSVVAALDYAIRFARARSLPLVVNMSFGVGNEREGAARLDRVVDSILAAHPGVVFVTSAGNDGPGLSTMGFPGSARRALTVGAIQASPFLPAPTRDGEPLLYFSSRGGELAKPDVVAPGTAYSTVPQWNVGDEFKSGTSMAAPHVAGLAALLLSAARAEGLVVSGADIRRALTGSARASAGSAAIDQGAGIPDLEAAWRILRSGPAPLEVEVDLPDRPGATAAFTVGRPDSAVTFRITRTRGAGPLEVTLTSDVPWIRVPQRLRIERDTTLVTLRQTAPGAVGTHSGTVRARSGGAVVFELVSTVVVPLAPTPGPLRFAWPSVPPGGTQRVMFAADSGRPFQVRFEAARPGQRVIASLHQPGGQPVPGDNGVPAGPDTLAAVFDQDGRDAREGYYEAVVTGTFDGPAGARIEVRHAPGRVELAARGDTATASLRSRADSATTGTLRFGIIGAERTYRIEAAGSAEVRIPLMVPSWAVELVADLRFEREQWPRFTDFGFAVVDPEGQILEKEPANYSTTRIRLGLSPQDPADPLTLLLAPGFADPGQGESWKATVTVRFIGANPVILTAREGDAFRLRPRETQRFNARIPLLPFRLPLESSPLVLFLMESGGTTWTWQLPLFP